MEQVSEGRVYTTGMLAQVASPDTKRISKSIVVFNPPHLTIINAVHKSLKLIAESCVI